MPLSVSISRLNREIMAVSKRQDLQWAHNFCSYIRDVHIDVWRDCPDPNYVNDHVIPLLELARNEFLSILHCGNLEEKGREIINSYINSVESRISNLKNNYMTGKPSAFTPIRKKK